MSHWTQVKVAIKDLGVLRRALARPEVLRRLRLAGSTWHDEPREVKGYGEENQRANLIAQPFNCATMEIGWLLAPDGTALVMDDMLKPYYGQDWEGEVKQEYVIQTVREKHPGRNIVVQDGVNGEKYVYVGL